MIAKTPPHGAVEIVPGEFEAPRMPIPAVFPRAAAGEDVPVCRHGHSPGLRECPSRAASIVPQGAERNVQVGGDELAAADCT